MLRFEFFLSLIACLMMKFQYLRIASLNVLQLFHQYSHFIRNFYNAINQKLTQEHHRKCLYFMKRHDDWFLQILRVVIRLF